MPNTASDLCVDEPVSSAPALIDPFNLLSPEERAAAVFAKARLETEPPFENSVTMAPVVVAPEVSIYTDETILTGNESRRRVRAAAAPENNATCNFREGRPANTHGNALHYYVSESHGARRPGQRVCDGCIDYCQRLIRAQYTFRRIPTATPTAPTVPVTPANHRIRSGHFVYGGNGNPMYQVRIRPAGVSITGERQWRIQFRSQYDIEWRNGVWTYNATVTDANAHTSRIVQRICEAGGFPHTAQRWFADTRTCIGCARATTNYSGFGGRVCLTNWQERR